MNRPDNQQIPVSIEFDLLRFLGAVVGGIVAYTITSNLPRLDSAVVFAVAIALSSFASTRFSHPLLWWSHLGAIAGGVVGTGSDLADTIAQAGLSQQAQFRSTVISCLGLAGFVSGILLGRNLGRAHANASLPTHSLSFT